MKRNTRGISELYADLDFDDLESRVMLAGDVTAVLDGSTLTLTGDDLSNAIAVDQVGTDVVVNGLFFNGNTTVNGNTFGQFSGVTNLVIGLNGGDDILLGAAFNASTLAGDLNIDMGSGADAVILGNAGLTVRGEANIDLGSEDDYLEIRNTVIGTEPEEEALRIFAENGNDGIILANVQLNEDLLVELGDGDDIVSATNVSIAHDVELFGGSGNEFIILNNVFVGTSVNEFTPDNALFNLGSGNDTLWLQGPLEVQDDLTVIGGAGNDTFAGAANALVGGEIDVEVEVII